MACVDVPGAIGSPQNALSKVDAVALGAVDVDLDAILALQCGGSDACGLAFDGECAHTAEREIATHLYGTI